MYTIHMNWNDYLKKLSKVFFSHSAFSIWGFFNSVWGWEICSKFRTQHNLIIILYQWWTGYLNMLVHFLDTLILTQNTHTPIQRNRWLLRGNLIWNIYWNLWYIIIGSPNQTFSFAYINISHIGKMYPIWTWGRILIKKQ